MAKVSKVRLWFRSILGSIKIWVWTCSTWTKSVAKDIIDALPGADNYDVRLYFFVLGYLILTVIGFKNMAILLGFIYVIWLLEKGKDNNGN